MNSKGFRASVNPRFHGDLQNPRFFGRNPNGWTDGKFQDIL